MYVLLAYKVTELLLAFIWTSYRYVLQPKKRSGLYFLKKVGWT